jgi:hypothetical protein
MESSDSLERVLAGLTPARIERVVRELSAARAAGDRAGVPVPAVVEALTARLDLGEGPEGWRAQLAITRAIREVLENVPGMRFVEGDA